MPHRNRPWSDELNVDVSIIHELEMALLGICQLFVRHLKFTAWSILGDGFSEKLAKWRRSGHVTVNVDNFLTVVHKTLLSLIDGLCIPDEALASAFVISSAARDLSPKRWVPSKDFSLRSK
jgi:hypothetical protein